MTTLVRTFRLLSIVVWVGGIVFFAFVLAPVAFSLLPSQHLAGIVVGGTLRVLDVIGMVCGGIFILTSAILFRRATPLNRRRQEVGMILALLMLLATAWLHAGILPTMERDRAEAGGDIEAASQTSPAKLRFERLHKRSEQVEGAVLFLGLGIILLMAREPTAMTQ